MRASEDWEIANHKAAEFWTESVKTVEIIEDALRALEAYYHYLEINNFELAGTVITNQRANRWDAGEPLGRSFYRLGLLWQIMTAINLIIDQVISGYHLTRLHNILGDLHWIAGNIKISILCHKRSKNTANKSLKIFQEKQTENFFRRMAVFSIFNIALCKIDLWEIQEAHNLMEQVKSISERYYYKNVFLANYNMEDILSCLAFLKSHLGFGQEASNYAAQAYSQISTANLDTWATGYSFLYLGLTYNNLGEVKKAFNIYRRAILYAEESHYTQVKAKALYGLAELYRIQGEFETALAHHSEAIELLDKIGAKCDLAEAYYQLGLTYQKMGEIEKSQTNFDLAIQLFTEMEAPKQVEKVQNAILTGIISCPLEHFS